MKTFIDCIPCLARQSLEAIRFSTNDPALQETLLREAMKAIANVRMDQSPPHMATAIHRMICTRTGNLDPYAQVKEQFNQAALELYPVMKQRVCSSQTPLITAIRLAIAGNVIDFGAPGRPAEKDLAKIVGNALSCPLAESCVDTFLKACERAKAILYLGDNAGEIVFDRLLLEQLGMERCTYVVRGMPILNDVTQKDAVAVGLSQHVEVISNGSDAPGTVLEWCSSEFVNRFSTADLVIAKGQGNYETLSNAPHPQLFFLLKAKCPVIATHLGCTIGDFILSSSACLQPA